MLYYLCLHQNWRLRKHMKSGRWRLLKFVVAFEVSVEYNDGRLLSCTCMWLVLLCVLLLVRLLVGCWRVVGCFLSLLILELGDMATTKTTFMMWIVFVLFDWTRSIHPRALLRFLLLSSHLCCSGRLVWLCFIQSRLMSCIIALNCRIQRIENQFKKSKYTFVF